MSGQPEERMNVDVSVHTVRVHIYIRIHSVQMLSILNNALGSSLPHPRSELGPDLASTRFLSIPIRYSVQGVYPEPCIHKFLLFFLARNPLVSPPTVQTMTCGPWGLPSTVSKEGCREHHAYGTVRTTKRSYPTPNWCIVITDRITDYCQSHHLSPSPALGVIF